MIHEYWWIVLIVLALVALHLLSKTANFKGSEPGGDWPFYAKKPLTKPEQILFHRLITALPNHIVLAQVQVSRVLGVKSGNNFAQWNNRINRLSYDFVVCAKDSTVIAVIELDDSSHNQEKRRQTDAKKNKATEAAAIKIIRWNVKDIPDVARIKVAILAQEVAAKEGKDPAEEFSMSVESQE